MPTRIGSPSAPVVPSSSSSKPAGAASAPGVATPNYGSSGESSFQAANPTAARSAAAASGGPDTSHVKSNVEEVNTAINRAIDDVTQGKTGDQLGPVANELYAVLGLKFYQSTAANQVLDKVRAYVKDHPDASMEDVMTALRGEAIVNGQVMKMMEKNLEEAMKKNPYKDD